MKLIYKELGDAVISVVTIVLLFAFLFGTNDDGFLYRLQIIQSDNAYDASWNDDQFGTVLGRSEPTITYLLKDESGKNNVIVAGKKYDMTKFFQAKDCDGKILATVINDVCTQSGDSILAGQKSVDFCFDNPGIYKVDLVATDGSGITAKKTIKIPVTVAKGG